MTDDEMSELAEAIAAACDDAIARGMVIRPSFGDGCCCPLGALTGTPTPHSPTYERYPAPMWCPVPEMIARGFIRGFDGRVGLRGVDRRAIELGRQFRRQYAGETA